jgi:hypothetical protein
MQTLNVKTTIPTWGTILIVLKGKQENSQIAEHNILKSREQGCTKCFFNNLEAASKLQLPERLH